MPESLDRFVAAALRWAETNLGSTDYRLRCLAFVEDAYERANAIELFGGSSATESAHAYAAADNVLLPPPAGAFVFYACAGLVDAQPRDWGHVGLCDGLGRVYHAWDVVRCDPYLAVQALTPAPTWEAPRYVGWAGVDRILQGHRPRKWVKA